MFSDALANARGMRNLSAMVRIKSKIRIRIKSKTNTKGFASSRLRMIPPLSKAWRSCCYYLYFNHIAPNPSLETVRAVLIRLSHGEERDTEPLLRGVQCCPRGLCVLSELCGNNPLFLAFATWGHHAKTRSFCRVVFWSAYLTCSFYGAELKLRAPRASAPAGTAKACTLLHSAVLSGPGSRELRFP